MNVLLLTPDAVGGTLLERLITIYMQFNQFDRPVIDVSHIELGLETYWCPSFNQQILRGTGDHEYRRMQSLGEIQALLTSVDHYRVIKLPYYNMAARKDALQDQVPFYRYLNDNYFIISCRRDNVFEHALSWSLNKITRCLNVFTTDQKIQKFARIYHSGVTIDPLTVIQGCNDYRRYLEWCDRHFQVSAYYHYERHMPNIEQFVLSLPIFAGRTRKVTWQQQFGQEFNDWNRCHYRLSDLGGLMLEQPDPIRLMLEQQSQSQMPAPEDLEQQQHQHWQQFLAAYQQVADPSWPPVRTWQDWQQVPEAVKQECMHTHDIGYHVNQVCILERMRHNPGSPHPVDIAPTATGITAVKQQIQYLHRDFMHQHHQRYLTAKHSIDRMSELGILPEQNIPIKKQTLAEKRLIINNFDECVAAYNDWAAHHPDLAPSMDAQRLLQEGEQQDTHWRESGTDAVSLLTR